MLYHIPSVLCHSHFLSQAFSLTYLFPVFSPSLPALGFDPNSRKYLSPWLILRIEVVVSKFKVSMDLSTLLHRGFWVFTGNVIFALEAIQLIRQLLFLRACSHLLQDTFLFKALLTYAQGKEPLSLAGWSTTGMLKDEWERTGGQQETTCLFLQLIYFHLSLRKSRYPCHTNTFMQNLGGGEVLKQFLSVYKTDNINCQ